MTALRTIAVWRAPAHHGCGGKQGAQPHDGRIKGRDVRLSSVVLFKGLRSDFARCA